MLSPALPDLAALDGAPSETGPAVTRSLVMVHRDRRSLSLVLLELFINITQQTIVLPLYVPIEQQKDIERD